MDSTTIFIVTASGGDYEDSWKRNVRAFRLKEEAENYVATATAQIVFINSIRQTVVKFYQDLLSVPVPEQEMPDPYPKGPARPTKQSWAKHYVELREWANKNDVVIERNNLRTKVHYETCYNEAIKCATSMGATEEHLSIMGFSNGHFDMFSDMYDATYEYEEIELL